MPHTFSDINGDGPMGLWDSSKATEQFQGQQHFVGGSMPEDGKSPFDDHKRPTPGSPDSFWGAPTQSDTFGGPAN